MGLIINTEDFVGKYRINQNDCSDLQKYIDKFESEYLQELLGCDLYELFKTDFEITGTAPTDAIYTKIFDEFCQDESLCIIRSQGMKEMLIGFIYYEFVKDAPYKAGDNGAVMNAVEVSTHAGTNEHDIYTRYNIAVETHKAIQWCICENSADYPTFNGQNKVLNHWSF